MKQKDIVIIIIVAGVSALVSLFLARTILSSESAYNLTAPTVSSVTSEFTQFNPKYVYPGAKNLTKDITIGGNTNTNPFTN